MGIQKRGLYSGDIHASRSGFQWFKIRPGTIGCILLLAALTFGCKPRPKAVSAHVFKGPFQTESQFIVQTVAADLAEQIYYAKFHRLPKPGYFLVVAREIPGTPLDTAEYEVKVTMDSIHSVSKVKLNLKQPIWSPVVYQGVAADLARAVGLKPNTTSQFDAPALLSKLTDASPETIEQENFILSRDLEKNFTDAKLHEQAAVLLGAFAMREHSGYFFDIRFPLSQMTAHLTLARFLNGTNAYGINGRMANAMLLTLIGNQAPALKLLSSIPTNQAPVAAFVRALQTRNTGDYQTLEAAGGLSPIESIEWFGAKAGFVSVPLAWLKLSDTQKRAIDFVRIANQDGGSVEMGHQLLPLAIPLELHEISAIYQLSHHQTLTNEDLVNALNQLPERGFTKTDGAVQVQVIGWGLWANFLQHQLCHAIQQDFNMLQRKWGVPEDAKKVEAKCDQLFAGLRLYPFVQRMDSTAVQSYHRSADACIKLTHNSPQLVPTGCWDWLFNQPEFAKMYPPDLDPHINEWFTYNPPLGTVYDLGPRMNHPSLIDRSDAVAYFEKLHALAPYDCRIINFILKKKYHDHPTYDQAMALYSNLMPYSIEALWTTADTVRDQPGRYEELMRQAARLNPTSYYTLSDYFRDRTNEDKAALYMDKACDADPDSVRVAYHAPWRVRYYLKKGQRAKARQIADFAGEVYSDQGLQAKALYFELTSNYQSAVDWYAKIDTRYDDPSPLLEFCARYEAKTGNRQFEPEVQKHIRELFPGGLEQVTLADFHRPPKDGVIIKEQNHLLTSSGMNRGVVIVAVYGVRVHNFAQYCYAIELKSTPEMDLIVWQDNAYHEFKPIVPHHYFDLDFGNYRSNGQ